MIQPQLLRIGNYIEYNGEIIKLDGSLLCCYIQNELDYPFNEVPLTEEILLKFGFYFEDDFYCLKINNTAFITIILLGSYVNYELSNFRQKIVFSRGEFSGVHQLQNLYFALTGEELTFKNPLIFVNNNII